MCNELLISHCQDRRLEDITPLKSQLTYGQVPQLVMPDGFTTTQSVTISRFLARSYGIVRDLLSSLSHAFTRLPALRLFLVAYLAFFVLSMRDLFSLFTHSSPRRSVWQGPTREHTHR